MGGTYSQIELTYANADAAQGQQWISLSDITFSILPTPEPSTALLLAAGLVAFGWIGRRV